MSSKPFTTSPTTTQLSATEYAVIRSYILGISESTIQQLLQLDHERIKTMWQDLFERFKLNNRYVVIRKVIQMGLIEVENYLPETIKTSTLDFIHAYQNQFPLKSPESEGEKWLCYHFLLKYNSFLERIEAEKKIPPKRD